MNSQLKSIAFGRLRTSLARAGLSLSPLNHMVSPPAAIDERGLERSLRGTRVIGAEDRSVNEADSPVRGVVVSANPLCCRIHPAAYPGPAGRAGCQQI